MPSIFQVAGRQEGAPFLLVEKWSGDLNIINQYVRIRPSCLAVRIKLKLNVIQYKCGEIDNDPLMTTGPGHLRTFGFRLII
jgi:hypothetical protein